MKLSDIFFAGAYYNKQVIIPLLVDQELTRNLLAVVVRDSRLSFYCPALKRSILSVFEISEGIFQKVKNFHFLKSALTPIPIL